MKKRFLTVALSLVMGFGVAASLASCGEVREDKGELTPVSYTHLDVYKRQGLKMTTIRKKTRAAKEHWG